VSGIGGGGGKDCQSSQASRPQCWIEAWGDQVADPLKEPEATTSSGTKTSDQKVILALGVEHGNAFFW